jgi:prepilin-type N-terminal cleavage/methylation domain-containing protein
MQPMKSTDTWRANRRAPPARNQLRRGLTLAELIAVLGVLAVLAATAWPTVRRMLSKSELLEAGKQVRTALVEARLRAIESGRAWQFRFQPGTSRYEVAPAEPLDETGRSGDPNPGPKPLARIEESLPGHVTFGGPDRTRLREGADDEGGDLAEADPEGDGLWAAPLVFQANGRAPDARIPLQHPEGRRLQVAFRGLTGSATIAWVPVAQPDPDLLDPEAEP